MTKEEFLIKFEERLGLNDKKWMLVSDKANKSDYLVSISGLYEVNQDFLYYIYNSEVWEVNLRDKNLHFSANHSFREMIKMTLEQKRDLVMKHSDGRRDVIHFYEKGKLNQVVIDLQKYGKKITTEQKSEPVLEELRTEPKFIDMRSSEPFEEILMGISKMMSYKNRKYGNAGIEKFNVFEGKCLNGTIIDNKLKRIQVSQDLEKNDVADIIGYLTLVCKEKGWTTFEDIYA